MPLSFKRFERIRSHFAFRFTKVGVAVLAMTLAVAIVATLTVDLGPGLRALAEREGSKRVGRPMHIGRLGVRLFNGKFVIEDFVIEGLVPPTAPFSERSASTCRSRGKRCSAAKCSSIRSR